MSLEDMMAEAVEVLRKRGHEVTWVTADAIVDGVPDEDGRLPDNPETFAGEEAGDFTMTCDGQIFTEEDVAGLVSVEAIVQYVEDHVGPDE